MSDSEDINDEEEDDNYDDQHYFLHPPSVEALHTPPIYHTPHIPTTGLMFWGSPDATSHPPTSHHIQTRPYSERKPLPHATPIHHKRTKEEMYPHTTHIQHSLHTERKPLPCATPIHWATPTLGPLTTPSSNKNFSWFKSQMIAELFEAFNRSVFDEKVSSKYIIEVSLHSVVHYYISNVRECILLCWTNSTPMCTYLPPPPPPLPSSTPGNVAPFRYRLKYIPVT